MKFHNRISDIPLNLLIRWHYVSPDLDCPLWIACEETSSKSCFSQPPESSFPHGHSATAQEVFWLGQVEKVSSQMGVLIRCEEGATGVVTHYNRTLLPSPTFSSLPSFPLSLLPSIHLFHPLVPLSLYPLPSLLCSLSLPLSFPPLPYIIHATSSLAAISNSVLLPNLHTHQFR